MARRSMNNVKFNILRRIIGKKMVIVEDHIKNIYFYSYIDSILDDSHVNIKNEDGSLRKISIFDIRSPSADYS
jgi:hypothetical protein